MADSLKKKILIITLHQFGYHTDYFKYAINLVGKYDVTYFCVDKGNDRIFIENVEVVYLNEGGRTLNKLEIISKINEKIRFSSFDYIITQYFPFVSFTLLAEQNIILDIRSSHVDRSYLKRWLKNRVLMIESMFFNKVNVISKDVRDFLFIDKRKVSIVPLGSDVISSLDKDFNQISLIYVGTLYNRKIEKTIKGLSIFIKSNKNSRINYTIIGSGSKKDEDIIKKTIEEESLEEIVHFVGYVSHNKLQHYFDTHNIGVSFIPLTNYYSIQPPTKTYEYLQSGLFCLATCTKANNEIINNKNGILFQDNAESFSEALYSLTKINSELNSQIIRKTIKDYTWENIVNSYFIKSL